MVLQKKNTLYTGCTLRVPPVRVGPGYSADVPGRVLPVTGFGSDPKAARFFGPGTRVPGYPSIWVPGVPVYPGYPARDTHDHGWRS